MFDQSGRAHEWGSTVDGECDRPVSAHSQRAQDAAGVVTRRRLHVQQKFVGGVDLYLADTSLAQAEHRLHGDATDSPAFQGVVCHG